MIIETNFSPGNHPLALTSQIEQPLLGCIIKQLGVMRMDTNSRVNPFVRLSQVNCPFERAALRIARADVEHRRHARISRARNHLFAIGIVFRAVDMTMRIDEHL